MTDVDILDVECLGILDADCVAEWLIEVETQEETTSRSMVVMETT